jgi:kynureninase
MNAPFPFSALRARFDLPNDVIYLLGHSLGPAPLAAMQAVERCAQRDWAHGLAASWNAAGWMQAGARVGGKIASRIGAHADEVQVCDSVTVNLFKLAGGAKMASGRAGFVIEEGGFPTDSYALEGVLAAIGGYALCVPREGLAEAITEDVAAVIATEVDFRTGARMDMAALSAAAHAKGALCLMDLSHSVGAVRVDLGAAGVDLAVGCGYKYLCGGPGAPGFVYLARRHHGRLQTPLPGWMGHIAPFAFETDFFPAPGAAGFACGTPPIISLMALEGALDAFAEVDPGAAADAAFALGERFDAGIRETGKAHQLIRITPNHRGAHLAYRFEEGFALKEALSARGVVGDFRAPDVLRFGFCPLFLDEPAIDRAITIVRDILERQTWRDFITAARPAVT